MIEFTGIVAGHGLSSMVDHIHAMVALSEKDGGMTQFNRAFEDFKASLPSIKKLEDLFLDKEGFQNRLRSGRQERWVAGLLPTLDEKSVYCDCLLTPLENGQLLFVAEHIHADIALIQKMQRLSAQVDIYKQENETAKKMMKRKQIELEGVMAQADEILRVDVLTFLPNRRLIMRELQDEVLRAERYDAPLSISVADIDFFKGINDTYGHIAGDEVLRQVGYQLRDHIRHPDIAGRYGGEEFLIILPNSSLDAAVEQAVRLCKQVRETTIHVKNHALQVTISIGVAEFKKGIDLWETLLNRADTAMYEAKRKGRDRWAALEN